MKTNARAFKAKTTFTQAISHLLSLVHTILINVQFKSVLRALLVQILMNDGEKKMITNIVYR